jgi:hypothetical protein
LSYREISAEDLAEHRFHAFGFDAVFVVARAVCGRCRANCRVVTRPYHDREQASSEALVTIRTAGWKAVMDNGTVCPTCQ